MSVYFMANIRIKDEIRYQEYLDRAGEVFAKYKGVYLAVDDEPEILEGNWEYTRGVLIRFDNREDFNAWYRSGEYQEILGFRLSSSKSDAILLQGK